MRNFGYGGGGPPGLLRRGPGPDPSRAGTAAGGPATLLPRWPRRAERHRTPGLRGAAAAPPPGEAAQGLAGAQRAGPDNPRGEGESAMENGLHSAYDYCQELTRREAKNFYYGFILLPSKQRRAIYAAYAFARECDDIVDAGLPAEEASARLAARRELLDRCLEGSPQGPVFLALADAVRRYGIPHDYFHRLIEGVETDLTVGRYANFEELKRYFYLVASA